MIQSFKEDDIDILIFVLHNIGLQLRKEETAKLKNLFDIAEQKRNQFSVFIKLEEADPNTKEDVPKLKQKLSKINFLMMEITDIKNNKGSITL